MNTDARILLLDLETSHNIIAAFQLFNQSPLPHSSIIRERYIILAAWQWLGEPKVSSVVSRKPWDDARVVKTLARVVQQADAVVAHNGKRFDLPFLRTRALLHGITITPTVEIDTLHIARAKFRFNNNRLDYLGQFLGLGRKQRTDSDLWMRVLQGDTKALADMDTYCQQDVRVLGRVFQALVPYLPSATVRALFGKVKCRSCGNRWLHGRGKKASGLNKYQCKECGTYTCA